MIAKIIVHGRDRQEAIARMRRTLEMTVIEGIKTSIPLHLKILADPDFVAGRLSTGVHGALHASRRSPAPADSPKRCSCDVRSHSDAFPRSRRSIPASVPARGRRSRAPGARLLARRAPACCSSAPRTIDARTFLRRSADALARPARRRTARVIIVNDRADIARAVRAPRASMSARTIFRPMRRATSLGARRDRRPFTHDAGAGRRQRCSEPIDLHRRRTDLRHHDQGHRLSTPSGSSLVTRTRAGRGKPVVAIGGITLERAPTVIAAGRRRRRRHHRPARPSTRSRAARTRRLHRSASR